MNSKPRLHSAWSFKRGVLLIIIALSLPLISSCSNSEQPNRCNWKADPFGSIPGGATNQRYSALNNKLAFVNGGEVGIIDLQTGFVTYVNPFQHIGDSLMPGFLGYMDWCPYDGNKLLITLMLAAPYDTVYPAGRLGLLFLHADGSFDTLLLTKWYANYLGWLSNSKPMEDSFLFMYVTAATGGLDSFASFATYCPESEVFSNPEPPNAPLLIRESPSGRHLLACGNGGIGAYLLDGNVVNWGDPKPSAIGSASFSPDEKHLAIWNHTLDGTNEEWIYNVDAMVSGASVSPIARLNFANMYCLGSFLGIWGEFVSDTSLVVSLHGDPAAGAQCNLYEVNFNGEILRQLTFIH